MSTNGEWDRNETRYPADLEIYIQEDWRRYVSRTREVSRGGLFFFASRAPTLGTTLSIQVHKTDDETIHLKGTVRNSIQDIGAGVEITGDFWETERYRTMVNELASARVAWMAIGQFVRSPNERRDSAPRGVLEHKEVVQLGESCEAIRILFDRYPPAPVEAVFARELVASGALKAHRLVGVSPLAVGLKLHARDKLRQLYVGALRDGAGYVAIVPPKDTLQRYRLYSLSGDEEIAVSAGPEKVFPYFSSRELERIARDTVLRVPSPPPPSRMPPSYGVPLARRVSKTPTDELPAFPAEHLPESLFGDWSRFEGKTKRTLELMVENSDAETRIYHVGNKQRAIRLFRDTPILVRDNDKSGGRKGVLLYDGKSICVLFGLEGGALEIRQLTDLDEVVIHPPGQPRRE